MAFQKGHKRYGGKKKGVPNKATFQLKEMILQALDEKGGVKYLVEQATKNPAQFLTLVGKVLPLQIANDPDNPLTININYPA